MIVCSFYFHPFRKDKAYTTLLFTIKSTVKLIMTYSEQDKNIEHFLSSHLYPQKEFWVILTMTWSLLPCLAHNSWLHCLIDEGHPRHHP